MKWHKKNGFIWALIVIAFFMMGMFSVFAQDDKTKNEESDETTTKEEDKECSCPYLVRNANGLADMYGLSVSYNSDSNYFTIKMDAPSDFADARKKIKNSVKFRVSSIEIEHYLSDGTLKKDTYSDVNVLSTTFGIANTDRLTYKNNKLSFVNIYGEEMSTYNIILAPDGFTDPVAKDQCKDCVTLDFTIALEIVSGGKSITTADDYDVPLPAVSHEGKLDCTNYATRYASNSFEYSFCKMKADAAKAGSTHVDFSSDKRTFSALKGDKATQSFDCNPFDYVKNNNTDSSSYYTNTQYMDGSISYEAAAGQYVYHFEKYADQGGKKESVSCKVSCQEYVKVEYGPPVASKAGLCFEYKVKVTSRVNCDMEAPPPPPKKITSYCTPAPSCYHKKGNWYGTAAGPNEDFDACIMECDGGKYGTKCSNKCYDKVYGSTNSKAERTSNSELDFANIVEKVVKQHGNHTITRTENADYNGKYVYNGNGVINWISNSKNTFGLGRYYKENKRNIDINTYECVKDTNEGGGILSVCGCSATCEWTGCEGDVYLNPGQAEQDYKANVAEYERVLNECGGKARCNTSQAVFTINVDYSYYANSTDKSATKTTIYFPYSNNSPDVKDTIQYNETSKVTSCTSSNQNSVILSSNGCYQCNSATATNGSANTSNDANTNWYQTEWSFAGTWIHNKTGEVSYTPKSNKNWTSYENKFCIPADSANANEDWWNSYYAKMYKDDTRFSYNDQDYLGKIKECSEGEVSTGITCDYESATLPSTYKPNYNIHAKTRSFGYFGWNIDINCFYAVSDTTQPPSFCKNNCMKKDDSIEQKRIRSVDLTNLFPDPSGSVLTSSSVTGRSPGFNWSKYATNTIKDTDYTSNPSSYTTWVQSKGYEVYSEDYLDYEVFLSKDILRKLKDSDRNFAEFRGTTEIDSVITYRSPLFSGGGLLASGKNVYPSLDALKCNNIGTHSAVSNYKSTCMVFEYSGEVK